MFRLQFTLSSGILFFGKKVESGNILRITNPFRARLEQKFLSNLKVVVSAGLR